MNTTDNDKGYCATCTHCNGVDEAKDVCICARKIAWADWRDGKEGPCPFWTDHIPTEAEELIDRIFVAVTNEEACAEAIVAEVGELLNSYKANN